MGKKTMDSQKKESRLDTQAILAGKMGSGVSITPAKPKLNIGAAGLTLGSGVTIKPSSSKNNLVPNSSVTITSNNTTPNSRKLLQQQQQLQAQQQKEEEYDPNLTDDTFV